MTSHRRPTRRWTPDTRPVRSRRRPPATSAPRPSTCSNGPPWAPRIPTSPPRTSPTSRCTRPAARASSAAWCRRRSPWPRWSGRVGRAGAVRKPRRRSWWRRAGRRAPSRAAHTERALVLAEAAGDPLLRNVVLDQLIVVELSGAGGAAGPAGAAVHAAGRRALRLRVLRRLPHGVPSVPGRRRPARGAQACRRRGRAAVLPRGAAHRPRTAGRGGHHGGRLRGRGRARRAHRPRLDPCGTARRREPRRRRLRGGHGAPDAG